VSVTGDEREVVFARHYFRRRGPVAGTRRGLPCARARRPRALVVQAEDREARLRALDLLDDMLAADAFGVVKMVAQAERRDASAPKRPGRRALSRSS
jgi:hypothetical protein